MNSIGDTFRDLADVLDALKAAETQYSLNSVVPVEEDTTTTSEGSVKVMLQTPFLDQKEIESDVQIKPSTVSLTDDGHLNITFILTEDTTETTESDENEGTEPQSTATQQTSQTQDKTVDYENQSQQDTTPAYQDPNRLQEVYDTHETFKEMTNALDVDVTPQTVRRHMIEYGIHKPASNTGSRTAEALLKTDPEDIQTKPDPRIPTKDA